MNERVPIVRLRPTEPADLDFVLDLERHAENRPFIGQWSREEHTAAMKRSDREHWTIEHTERGSRVGFLIAYDLVREEFGVYVKRIVVVEKSRGLGRAALQAFVQHAFRDLSADNVWLSVYAENERARRSYQALGFQVAPLTDARRRELCAAAGGFSDRSLVMVLDGAPAVRPRIPN